MDNLLQWGWQGALILAIPYIIFRMVPVALDAWKGNNPGISLLKTFGPIFSMGVLIFGGWVVIRAGATWIYNDAQRTPLVIDAQQWTGSGAGALEGGMGAISNYVSALGSGLADSAPAGSAAASEAAQPDLESAPAISGAADNTWNGQPAAAPARPAQPAAAQPAAAQAAPAPTRAVGVHAAQPDYAGAISPDEINSMAEINARQGEKARAEATRTGDSSSLNGNSEMLMFGGGGPTVAQADAALKAAEQPQQRTYRVQRGEGLSDISLAMYGTKDRWDDICTANKLRDCNRLSVNQLLIIP